MKNKQSTLYGFLVFLVRATHMLGYLWKTRKAIKPCEQERPSCVGCYTRMLRPMSAAELEILLYKAMKDSEPLKEASWYNYLSQYKLGIISIYYNGDRQYEVLRYIQPPNPPTPVNTYLYPYDQRKVNLRKLGKPTLGLSPPIQ